MGMQFELTITGEVEQEAEAEDLGLDLDDLQSIFDTSSSVQLDDGSVSGSVTISASARVENVDVSAEDMAGYDADAALNEYFGYGVNVSNADFEITEEPTGFDAVTSAVGYDRDVAIAVYAALASAGHEVI
jgi:hypothetical protein